MQVILEKNTRKNELFKGNSPANIPLITGRYSSYEHLFSLLAVPVRY